MDENLKYYELTYIENEYPADEKRMNEIWNKYNGLLDAKMISSFEEFVKRSKYLPKTRENFARENFDVDI